MTARTLLAVLVGVAVGVTAVTVGPPHTAAAPNGNWQYKVVVFTGDRADSADKHTEQFNTLAGNGWEHVGPVVARPAAAGGGHMIAFRRSKP